MCNRLQPSFEGFIRSLFKRLKGFLRILPVLAIIVVIDKWPSGGYFWNCIDNTGRGFEPMSAKDYSTASGAKAAWIRHKDKVKLTRQWRYVDSYKYDIEPYIEPTQ